MTTYTLHGIYVRYDQNDQTDTLLQTTLSLAAEPGITGFSYFYDGTNGEGNPTVDINGLFATLWPHIEGGPQPVDFEQTEAQIVDVSWTYNGSSGTQLSHQAVEIVSLHLIS